jgi:hypothetical protein
MAAGGARLGVRRQRARLASLVLSIGARALGRESWLARAETTGVKAWAVGRRRRACGRVRRRRRWWVGASRFRAARERVARGNVGFGANVDARS